MTALAEGRAAARAAADSIVLLADPDAVAANPFYWHRARPAWESVAEALAQISDPFVVQATEELRRDPSDLDRHDRLCEAVLGYLTTGHREWAAALGEALARVHADARIGYQPGIARVQPEVRPRMSASRHPAVPEEPLVNVVIPFRDDHPAHGRLENLTACLAALHNQSLDARRYAVTVVESDTFPRWRDRISPLADEYVFVRHDGPFNKSWAVNVGVTRTRFQAPLICVLDADALPDREFLARNVARFDAAGVGSFIPMSTVLYLDEKSSARAIEDRCVHGVCSGDSPGTRGFRVYCSPGVCVWMRRSVFDGIHGLDERYEGWGGEDMDLLLRLMTRSAFHQYDDVQLHLHHWVRPGILDEDGHTPNRHLRPLTWEPTVPIGDPGKYAVQLPATAR